jgi:hypothetical protein
MKQWLIFGGAFRYEFHMQLRRLALWATFGAFAALVFAIAGQGNWTHWSGERNAFDSFSNWTVVVNLFIPPALGVLLADRLYRDHKLHVDELFNTMPATMSAWLLGKFVGCLLATLVPMLMIYGIGIGYISYHWLILQGGWSVLRVLPGALALFLAVIVPGATFVASFSLALPRLLWLPLYQFLFVGYWFWGNALAPTRGLPTLSNTLLTPLGGYMLAGFFGEDSGLIVHQVTFWQGVESLLLLLGVAACVLTILWRYLLWQQVRS